jgi:hypothetical protein
MTTLYKKKKVTIINQSETKRFEQHLDNQNNEQKDNVPVSFARRQLLHSGMRRHFQSLVGGNRSFQSIKILETHMVKYLLWTYLQVYNYPINLHETNIVTWMLEVVQHHYNLLPDYSTYLETIMNFRGGSILNNLYDIVTVVRWLAHFKPLTNNDGSPLHVNVDSFEFVLRAVAKNYRKQKRFEANQHDMETAVANRRLPKDGIKTLIQCVIDDASLFEENPNKSNRADKETFQYFVSMMYASFYVLSTQGRIGGFTSIVVKQADDLLQNGYILSKNFKTRSSWIYQPVTISELSSRLFRHYITNLRPQISPEVQPNDPLWVNWEGQAEDDIGGLITRYFKKKLEIHITTTGIRSLVETQAQELLDGGIISAGERESISYINGHTSSVAKMYYVERDRVKDVHNTRNFFSHIIHNGPSPVDLRNFDTAVELASMQWPTRSVYSYRDWGVIHPDYGKNTKRAVWTGAELDFIYDWMNDRCVKNVERGHLRHVSALWHHITEGAGLEKAVPIFHVNHILDATRLRHGYRIICGDRPSRTMMIM